MCVALEFARHGDLRTYIRRSRRQKNPMYENTTTCTSLKQSTLHRFALDCARGLAHLADAQVRKMANCALFDEWEYCILVNTSIYGCYCFLLFDSNEIITSQTDNAKLPSDFSLTNDTPQWSEKARTRFIMQSDFRFISQGDPETYTKGVSIQLLSVRYHSSCFTVHMLEMEQMCYVLYMIINMVHRRFTMKQRFTYFSSSFVGIWSIWHCIIPQYLHWIW